MMMSDKSRAESIGMVISDRCNIIKKTRTGTWMIYVKEKENFINDKYDYRKFKKGFVLFYLSFFNVSLIH